MTGERRPRQSAQGSESTVKGGVRRIKIERNGGDLASPDDSA